MIININTDATATDSLIDRRTLNRIPSNFEFVKGDQIEIFVRLYDKNGNEPAILSRPDLEITTSVGKIATRELLTKAQTRSKQNGTFGFVLDLARQSVTQATGSLAIEVSLETSLESEVLLQAPIRLKESFISSPLLPSYPSNLAVESLGVTIPNGTILTEAGEQLTTEANETLIFEPI